MQRKRPAKDAIRAGPHQNLFFQRSQLSAHFGCSSSAHWEQGENRLCISSDSLWMLSPRGWASRGDRSPPWGGECVPEHRSEKQNNKWQVNSHLLSHSFHSFIHAFIHTVLGTGIHDGELDQKGYCTAETHTAMGNSDNKTRKEVRNEDS